MQLERGAAGVGKGDAHGQTHHNHNRRYEAGLGVLGFPLIKHKHSCGWVGGWAGTLRAMCKLVVLVGVLFRRRASLSFTPGPLLLGNNWGLWRVWGAGGRGGVEW